MRACSKRMIVFESLMSCLACVHFEICEATRDITAELDSRLMQLAEARDTRVMVATPVPTPYDYIAHDIGIECFPGSEITSMAECQQGATSLGITFVHGIPLVSSSLPYGCYFFPDATMLFHNTCSDCATTSATSEAICRQVTTPAPTLAPWLADGRQYVEQPVGTDCTPGFDVTSLEECQYGATQLTIVFTSSRTEDTPSLPYGCNFYYGLLAHNACTTCGNTSMFTHAICRQAPIPPPTPSPPTSAPTVGTTVQSGALTQVSAKGDPHLQNIHGQHFDLMKPGKHVLIHIPRRARIAMTSLKVEGDVQQLGGPCEMYFQELNITGKWVKAERSGGLNFRANGPRGKMESKWLQLGEVRMKIVHGRTNKGTRYLNFYVKGLSTTHLVVGGLLGEDDHSEEAQRPRSCGHRIAL